MKIGNINMSIYENSDDDYNHHHRRKRSDEDEAQEPDPRPIKTDFSVNFACATVSEATDIVEKIREFVKGLEKEHGTK